MPKAPTEIASLFHVPQRFLRSAQLERDFYDPHALDGYIVTPAMSEGFHRIAAGLRPGSGQRAWRVTGDYGVGKSSFALVLAHLLRHPGSPAVARLAETADWPRGEEAPPILWPVLITGAQEGLIRAVARGIGETLQRTPGASRKKALVALASEAARVAASGGLRDLEALVETLRAYAAAEQAGVLLVIDELGKLLEYAAGQPEPEDVFVLQRLAEMAARSGDTPFVFIGMLHQAFGAYASRLPTSVRLEWEKIAGRFEEIPFDQPLMHTAALVAGALGVRAEALPRTILEAARDASDATARIGWLGGGVSGAAVLNASAFYPLHPTLLPPLVRFFARFGQHERSLFGFLLSQEPNGLQVFASRPVDAGDWYGLPEFYDYVRANYGHRLAGDSYQNHWLRIAAVVSQTDGLSELELRVLKTIAVLNLLDAEDLLPTDTAIAAALTPARAKAVQAAVQTLVDRGVLHRRGAKGGYRLWPNTSVNLHAVMSRAVRALDALDGVSAHLPPYLDQEPLLARRHYIERGTLRYFEVRYALADALAETVQKPTSADGLVVVALSDTDAERARALEAAAKAPFSQLPAVIVGVGRPLAGLQAELLDLKRWTWISDHTPELAHDPFAAEEVARQIAGARRLLSQKLAERAGLKTAGEAMIWFREGRPQPFAQGLTAGLSQVCDELYDRAPQVLNELINRNVLSSAAAAARGRLIDGLFKAVEKPALGIDQTKAPPERSMYLSVLKAGGLHVQGQGDGWRLVLPKAAADRLNLRPVLDEIARLIDRGRGRRVPVTEIFAHIRRAPYGVRDGLAPLLLAIVLRLRGHGYAVYEAGTFVPSLGPAEFLRLIKGPAAFEIQYCQIEGVRADVFERLAETFASGVKGRQADLLDVVTPLCQFAAGLPEYTQKAGALTPAAAAVRDALMSAREPAPLLFEQLPVACGFPAFDPDQPADARKAAAFVATLQAAVTELKDAYLQLIGRIVGHVARALGEEPTRFDRAKLAQRAARVSLAARELRLRGFALQMRDAALVDERWAENLGSFTLSRPPKKWAVGDEARFQEEIGVLAEVFVKVEAAAFTRGDERPAQDAVRLNLTRGDGRDAVLVVNPSDLDAADLEQLDSLRQRLPQAAPLRVKFLTQLLWDELAKEKAGGAPADGATAEKARRGA